MIKEVSSVKQSFLKKIFTPINLRDGKEWKSILIFSIPIIISFILQQLYVLSDAMICGQALSSDEVAGVNDVYSLTFVFLQFSFGCTAGFCVITSSRIGKNDEQGIRHSFAAQIILCILISIFLMVVATSLLNYLLSIINVTPQNKGVYTAAYQYCFVIFIGIFAQIFYNMICSILRSIGDSITPLMFLLMSTILNIILDIIFIVSFKWGVIGAALATIFAQSLSTILCFIYTFRKYKQFRLHKEDFMFPINELWIHFKQGFPLGFQFSLLAIGIIFMQGSIVSYDLLPNGNMVFNNPAQNGFGAANKVKSFMMSPISALGTALVSFNAQNLGAKNYDRIKKGTLQSILIVFAMYAIILLCGLLFTINGNYQYIFLSPDKISSESIKFGNYFLYIDLSLFFILGIMFVFRNGVQGIAKSHYTLLAGLFELIARIALCLTLPPLVNGGSINAYASDWSYLVLCLADPLAWTMAIVALIYPFIHYIILKKYDN